MSTIKSTARVVGKVSFPSEIRYTPAGKAVWTFSVSWKASKEATEWSNVRVTVWGEAAAILKEEIMDGEIIAIGGDLHVKNYTDKSGQKRTSVEVHVNSVDEWQRLGTKKQQPALTAKIESPSDILNLDIPF